MDCLGFGRHSSLKLVILYHFGAAAYSDPRAGTSPSVHHRVPVTVSVPAAFSDSCVAVGGLTRW
jgi:hypothetical protein